MKRHCILVVIKRTIWPFLVIAERWPLVLSNFADGGGV